MKRISLNDSWSFARLPDGLFPPAAEPDWEAVALPHTWYTDETRYHGLALYRRTLPVDPA